MFILEPLLTPSSMGRWTLSRMAWRGRRASPRSLGAPCRRLEPLTRLVRALAWLRRSWGTGRDFHHNWRAVCMLDAGGCSSFWRFHTHVDGDVRQCSAWRGLHRVCSLSPSDHRHRTSFSQGVSHIPIFVKRPTGRPREVVSMRSL